MAFKLVYTSAPRGLKEGSFGFCTVGCSRNLSERTIAALEAFSGYRRLFVDAERAAQNPIAYSHVLLDDGETTLRVLSRIADAGLDYSNRNNKIASHLVLEHTELREAGPAAFFAEPELFDQRWEGSPQIFNEPFVLPKLTSKACCFEEWKKITGDPGWAGVLASTVYTERPVVLITRPEHNVLALYQEALSLLTPVMRWQATFSTYYAKTPPGIQCQWKATTLGSRESQTLRALPFVLVLDLTSLQTTTRPEEVDSSPYAVRFINVARGVANKQILASSAETAPILGRQTERNNNGAKLESPYKNVHGGEKKEFGSSSNKSFVTSAKKILDYGRKLPLKNYFEKNAEESKRWRVGCVAFVSVFALAALIFIGIDIANGVGKKSQGVQNEIPNESTSESSDELNVVLTESKTSYDSKDQNVDSNNQASQDEDAFPIDSSGENSIDIFAFDEGNAQKNVKGKKTETVALEEQSDVTAIDSKTKEKKAVVEEEFFIDGADLSDDLERSPLLSSIRRPQFLTSEEFQTTVIFKELVSSREFTIDFGLFQRGINAGTKTLSEEIEGESQEIFSDVLELCRKYNGKLGITCDLSADQNNERQWISSKQRANKQEVDFSNIKSSNSVKVVFKTLDANDDKQNGFLSIEIDSQGKLTFNASDERTRNYFLRSSKLKWTITLSDPDVTGKDFVVETKYAQLLRPCEYDLLKDPKTIASIIELTNGGLLPLVVPSSLSYYDPIRNAKHSPALLVLLNPDSTSNAFNVESQMDEKKKSIVFVFKLKAENVDALKIRFTRNSQVVRSETIFDRESLKATLEDYFNNQSYPPFPYDTEVAYPQNRLQNALHKVEAVLTHTLTFDFYLVSTTGSKQKDQSKYVFLGSASVKPEDLDRKEK